MLSHEAFKFGMLMQCAEEGLSEEATHDRLTKAAALVKTAFPGEKFAGDAGRLAAGVVSPLMRALFWGAILGPPVVGTGLGYAAAKTRGAAYDKELAKTDEEIAEYHRAIDQLQRARRQRSTV
jgi:hypothetical protein